MVWQLTDALDEVDAGYGPNLLIGDYQAQNPGWVLDGNTWSGEGSLHLHEGDPIQGPITAGDTTHVLTADVLATAGGPVSWSVDLDTMDGPVTLGPWEDTIPGGVWVTVRQEYRTPPGTISGSPTFTITGLAQVRAPRTSRVTGQIVVRQVVAGDPEGARVELTEVGLVAYDAMDRETARIAGDGGEFVGGRFRTSDALPGQVMLSDEGLVDPANQSVHPGIRITPTDASQLESPPGIGPNSNGLIITGGRNLQGGRGFSIYAPEAAQIRYVDGPTSATVSAARSTARLSVGDGAGGDGEVRVTPSYAQVETVSTGGGSGGVYARPDASWLEAKMADGTYSYIQSDGEASTLSSRDAGGGIRSEIMSNGREAYLWSTGSDGTGRVLSVDSEGVWVKVSRNDGSGYWDHYNLEETVQDSDWQPITLEPGITGTSSPAWRNKNGVIYFQGFVNTTWVQGWNTIATGLDVITPVSERRAVVPVGGAEKPLLRMTETGALQMYTPTSGGRAIPLSSLIYPLG